MRVLADNPSMEFLRREAKDLLGALRESEPGATLADAQRALADVYGFRTWGDLKAEVDRRRDAVPEAPPGLAAGLAEHFGLGDVTGLTPVRYEYMGRRWCLETERGRFLLSPVFDWIGDAQASVAVDLQERARAAGVASPVPVRTADGGLVRRVADQNWRVDEWIDLGPAPLRPVAADVAGRLGELLATIHGLEVATDRAVEGPWITHRPSEASWAGLLERAERAGKRWAPALAALSPIVRELGTIVGEADPGSAIISNCDLVPEGVRLGPDGRLVVVHWDFTGPMIPTWELGTVLVQWALHERLNVGAARAILDGYRRRAGTAPTLTLGSFHVGVTGWLNWAYNQACEAIDPRSADKADFAERALQATLVDPLRVSGLEDLLAALEPVRP